MECLQFHAARGIKKIRAKIPSLKDKPDHVLIQVDFCGICGSDIHILDGSSYYKDDVILGHEITGTIVELGKNISTKQGIKLSIGTNVVVLPQNSCQQCYQCKQGRPNFCQDDNGGFGSTIGYYHNGGFAQYVTCHVTQVYPFDNVELPSPIATLCEPLQCVLNGFNKLESLLYSRKTEKLNLKILIIGFGICGYLWSLLLAEKGFTNINICEVSEKRWKIAKCLDHIDNAWLNMKIKDDGFDIVIECAGTVESTKLGYSLLNTSGIFIIFGGTSKGSPMLFDPSYILFKELRSKYNATSD